MSFIQDKNDGKGPQHNPCVLNQDGTLRRPPILTMRSGANAVAAGGSVPGWVSGDIASLAASAMVDVIFDLGPQWDQYPLIQVAISPVSPSSGLQAVQISGSDTAAYNLRRRLAPAFIGTYGTTYMALTSASGPQTIHIRPMGRYVIVRAQNADATNAQAATAGVDLTAYPT